MSKIRDSTTYYLLPTIYKKGFTHSSPKLRRIKLASPAFTIVELLVVIVVIGVLAAITIVSYTGISNKATVASLTSDLDNASRLLKLDQIVNSGYPATLALANNSKGLTASNGANYYYSVNNSVSPQAFCLNEVKGTTSYKITNDSAPVAGDCQGYGLVLSLDAGDNASYPGSGTTWNDISGKNNNATLNNVTYNSAGAKSMTFNGTTGYVSIPSSANYAYGTTDFTWELWISGSSFVSGNNYLIDHGSNGGTLAYQGGKLLYYNPTSGTGGSLYTVGFGSSFSLGNWYHVVATRRIGITYLYLNGILSTSATDARNYTAQSITLGNYGGGGSYYWNGSIAYVRLYNRSFTADEVLQSFNDRKTRFGL